MNGHTSMLAIFVVSIAAALAVAAFSSHVLAATTDCPTGTVAITAATRADATAAGVPTSSACWNPNDANAGMAAAQAKQYLRSILCSGSNFGGAGPDATIQGLQTQFAVCAAKFLKAENGNAQITGSMPLYDGGSARACVREGYRTPAQQNLYYAQYKAGTGGIACAKGANCEHPRGIAIDVNVATDQDYQLLWNQASSFGVNFYLRARDKVHFVPLSQGCAQTAGTLPNVPTTSTSPGATPTTQQPSQQLPATYYDFPEYAPAQGTLPISSLLPSTGSQLSQPGSQYTSGNTAPSYTLPGGSSNDISSILSQTQTISASSSATSSKAAADLLKALAAPFSSLVPNSSLTTAFGNTLSSLTTGGIPIPVQNTNTNTNVNTDTQVFVAPTQTGFVQPTSQTQTPGDMSGTAVPAVQSQSQTLSPIQSILSGVQRVLVNLLAYIRQNL